MQAWKTNRQTNKSDEENDAASAIDAAFFHTICTNLGHVLMSPPCKGQNRYQLEARTLDFTPPRNDEFSFIARNMYKGIY